MDLNSTSIKSLGLSVRSENALIKNNIATVSDLIVLSEDDLYQMRNLGVKSVNEILEKIIEIKSDEAAMSQIYGSAAGLDNAELPSFDTPESFEEWLSSKENQDIYLDYLKEEQIGISALDSLPVLEYNLLLFSGNDTLEKIVFRSKEELEEIPRVGPNNAKNISRHIRSYVRDSLSGFAAWLEEKNAHQAEKYEASPSDLITLPEYRDRVLEYVRLNDAALNSLGLSARTGNCMARMDWNNMSDIIFYDRTAFYDIDMMGKKSVDEIMAKIHDYLEEHGERIIAYVNGNEDAVWNDQTVQKHILRLFSDLGFKGLSFIEIKERLDLPKPVAEDKLKQLIGKLIAAGELEYVDYRCHRVYPKFEDCLDECTALTERETDFIKKRLRGITLNEIGSEFDITRERVRQVIKKGISKVRDQYLSNADLSFFDEDYYRHLFETYSFDQTEGSEWLGIPPYVWRYLRLNDCKPGSTKLSEAIYDQELNVGLRLKIKNYLHKDQILIDGNWVNLRRYDLEDAAIRDLCRENISYNEFAGQYNRFLESLEIPYDEKLYYTDQVLYSRKNRLADSRNLLWKQNEMMRYYDIDGQDYSELLDTLQLDSYENVVFSTQKFMDDYPEVMLHYDIRDRYELHNLLKKTIPDGSYHDLHFSKMPTIRFGEFDRDAAIFDLMAEHAPITPQDLAEIVHQEYGYEQSTVSGSYFTGITPYYSNGIYSIDFKVMSEENSKHLSEQLTDDFYFIDEIRNIYGKIAPEADTEEINPYNMSQIGFTFRSKYVIRKNVGTDEYIRSLLTSDEIVDIRRYRSRFASLHQFYNQLSILKQDLDIIEFEPGVVINYSKLERQGITKDVLMGFCDDVFSFVQDKSCFSIQTLKQDGFESELFELGFSDWFYSNLLIAEERLTYGRIFGNLIFSKGSERITRRSFIIELINASGSIDRIDLIDEMTDRFGCVLSESDQANITAIILKDSNVVYDQYLDRLYKDEELFFNEIDEQEEF